MKQFETKFESASVFWSVETEFSYDARTDEETETEYVCFDLVYCSKEGRGNGYTKKALRLAIEEAKNQFPELPIRLVVEPQENEINADGLVRLYNSVGFDCIHDDCVIVMEYKL